MIPIARCSQSDAQKPKPTEAIALNKLFWLCTQSQVHVVKMTQNGGQWVTVRCGIKAFRTFVRRLKLGISSLSGALAPTDIPSPVNV